MAIAERKVHYMDKHLRLDDFPLFLGSVDATVQRVSRPKNDQGSYYTGNHKCHMIKVQSFVSPFGLLIHFIKSVLGSVHDFSLFKESAILYMKRLKSYNRKDLKRCERKF